MGQEAWLPPGTRLTLKTYHRPRPDWDHDHCSFCSVKFVGSVEAAPMADEDVRTEGYTTTPEYVRGADYHWICVDCFADFNNEFGWVAVEA